MAERKETYIGNSKLKGSPENPIKIVIGENAVKSKHIADSAVTKGKLGNRSVEVKNLDDDVQNLIASMEKGGVALSGEFGDSELIGINQKKLTEVIGPEGTITQKVASLEETVGEGGSIDERIAIETNRAQAAEELLREAYESLSQSQAIPKTAEEWAAMTSWEEGVIYRVAGTTSYTDYMYNGTITIPMATYNNAIDDEPTAGSDNLVKSGGVYGSTPTIANSSVKADLDISDESGNVLARFARGHLRVKNFSSVDVLDSIQAILSNIGFDNVPEFSEEEDYAIGDIVRYEKYVYAFISEHTAGEWDETEVEKTTITSSIEHPVDVTTDNSTNDLDISDEHGNVLIRCANGHIKTKNFNSADTPSSVVPPKQYFPDFDVASAPNYPDHDSTIVDNTIWAFHGNRYDVAAGFGGAVYDLNLNKLQDINTKFLWQKADGSGTQELEMKSVDFNSYNRVLAVGNGSARTGSMPNDSYIFLFYDCDDWLTAQGEVNFTNCGDYTKLDVSELGVKSYAFWSSKNPVSDQIFINVNFWKDFYLLRLGKGTNRLSHGSYIYIDNQKYNGTWDILNHWTTNLSPDTQAHGGQYYKGHLYIASNDSSRFIIYDFELNKNNSVVANEILCEARIDNSNRIKYQYPDGMCIHQDIIYVQPLIVNGGSSIQNKVVLKIKL